MKIKRIESRSWTKGPPDSLTGAVRIRPLFDAPEPARVRGARVEFEPGARRAWHKHPLDQTFVTSGVGWAQREPGSVEESRPRDVVGFAPNEKQWHGSGAARTLNTRCHPGNPRWQHRRMAAGRH